MQQQRISMPVRCSQCGELFDISYDLKRNFQRQMEEELENRFNWKDKKAVLCWECRNT